MTDAIVKANTLLDGLALTEVFQLADALSRTKMIPVALQGKRDDIVAQLLRGRELGLPPMAALNSLYLINGKTGMAAEVMLALARKSPHCLGIELKVSNNKVCTYRYLRKGQSQPKDFSFTIEQANQAGLRGDNWAKRPDAMLRARCASALVRAEFSDVLIGGVYDVTSGEFEEATAPPPKSNGAPPADWPIEPVERLLNPEPEKVLSPPAEGATLPEAWEADPTETVEESPAQKWVDEIRSLQLEGKLAPNKVFGWVNKNVPAELKVTVANALKEDK